MFAVSVEFIIREGKADDFREAVLKQAQNSLARESECHQFDVCIDPADGCRFFLYELYTDEKAFGAHRQTEHYHGFDTRVKDWIAGKTVKTWEKVAGGQPK